jgi:DNA polymerase III epsilon subunit-like protein
MHKLLIVDTETGGLDPSKHSLLSVGAVVWQDGQVTDKFEVFIAEPCPNLDPEAMQINQINITWLWEHGLQPRRAIEKFHEFLSRNFDSLEGGEKIPIAGHNIGFDIGFLKRLYELVGMDYGKVFSHRVLDTAGIIQFLIIAEKIQLPGAGSTEAFRHFNVAIDPLNRHTALGDALATATLLNRLIGVIRST